MNTLETAGEAMGALGKVELTIAQMVVEIERKDKLLRSFIAVLKTDRHDWEDWPADSQNVVASIQKELAS